MLAQAIMGSNSADIFKPTALFGPQAYVTCTIGIHRVGFVMVISGVASGISCILFTRLSKYTGRRSILTAATIAFWLITIFLLLWRITASYTWIIYLLAMVLGSFNGLYEPLANGESRLQLFQKRLVKVVASDTKPEMHYG